MSEEHHSGGAGGAGGSGKQPLKLVPPPPLPVKREVSERHLANLATSGLSPETIELAQLYTEWDHKLLALLVQRRVWPRMCGAALVFPFFVPGATEPDGYRLRPTTPRVERRRNGKERLVKYESPTGAESYVYFPPRARAAAMYGDGGRKLFWCEGEKKALVLDQLGLACVGLTGVWLWHDVKHRDETGEWRLHPVIREHVTIAGREHVICFDADARDKDEVMMAAQRLCGVLRAAGAISVEFVCPPSKEHKGIDDFYAAFGGDVTLALLAAPDDIEPLDPKSPLQLAKKVRALSEAPVSDSLRLPEGYKVERDGTLWRLGDKKHGDVKIARSAILITRYLDDYYTHEGRVEVCYERDGCWVPLCVGRRAIADARTMVAELSAYGAPVTSNSAAKVVDWLEDIERVNTGRIERHACVSRAGWHTINGERLFVLNEPIFADDDHARPLALDTRGDRKKMFGALEPRGDFDKHLIALKRAWTAEPIAAAAMCGVLAATLLEPLGAPNFAIHLPGDSSRGKTSMLKIAASLFGDPNNDSWVASWNTTAVGAELRAATLTDLPQCYDEVGSSDITQIERMVYMLVNGGGRARAQRDLTMRETPSWRTVVVSTGERELADESTATGAQVRVIQLPVTRFGPLTAIEIDDIREQSAAHAGSFGRAWIEMLLTIDDWAPWRDLYRNAVKTLREGAVDGLQGRIASFFAVLAVAESLAAKLGLGDERGRTMEQLYRDASKREAVLSLADRSVGLVNDWVLSEGESFPELGVSAKDDSQEPPKGSGKTRHGFRRAGAILLIGRSLRSFCDSHHLSVREVLREWKLRGWLECEGTRFDKVFRIGGTTSRFHCLRVHPTDNTNEPEVSQ